MKVLVIEPKERPYEKEISGDLKSMQGVVGGKIEAVRPYDEPVCLVCNREGKINELPRNREIPEISDIIHGTFFICGYSKDVFKSLDEAHMKAFTEKFYQPHAFVKMVGGSIAVVDMPEKTMQNRMKAKKLNAEEGKKRNKPKSR